MHVYIYDHFLSQKKYERILARIETRITDLGLNGRIIRLGLMHNVYDAIENEIKRGAKTIIAVGNDKILNQILNSMAILESQNILNRDLPLGFIPVDKNNNKMAEYLGIENEELACNILAARRIAKLDLGLANNIFFLGQVKISAKNTVVKIDDKFTIEPVSDGQITVINLPINLNLPSNIVTNAGDDMLELLIVNKDNKNFLSKQKKAGNYTLLRFKDLLLINKNLPAIIDDALEILTPVKVTIAKEKINFIVGKDRKF